MDGAGLFKHSITVQRKSATKDASGAQVEAFASVASLTNLPCLVQPRHGKAVRMIGGRQVIVSHAIYIASDLDIRRGDRILWNDENVHFTHAGYEDMAGQSRISRIECSLTTE